MTYFLAWLIGSLAGLHISTWGMYKDAPHEGFTWPKYFRSAIVGGIVGLVAIRVVGWKLDHPAQWFVYWGLCYALERATTEFWKYFIREEDQSKYFIPMQFGVMGKPMKDARKRISIGVLIGLIVVAIFIGIEYLDRANLGWPRWLVVVTIGSIGGWVSAFGGAWKDAPVEGFETFKFFRSPSIAATWAAVVSQFTNSYLAISVAAIGFTVASIETWKTFYHADKPRGKFAGKPITHPEMLERRRPFGLVYAGIWLAVLLTLGLAFRGSEGAPWPESVTPPAATAAVAAEASPAKPDSLAQSLLTQFGAYGGTYVVSIIAGLVPLVNAELYLAALATQEWSHGDLAMLALLASLGQMTAKVGLYYTAQGAIAVPGKRLQASLDRARERMTAWNDRFVGVFISSAVIGLPPFYLVSLAAGVLKMSLLLFLALGITGRFVRFIALLTGVHSLW